MITTRLRVDEVRKIDRKMSVRNIILAKNFRSQKEDHNTDKREMNQNFGKR